MADSNIGALPQVPQLDDESLLVAEQQGQAMKVTGAQFKEFGRQAVIGQVQGYVDAAEKAATEAVDAVSAVTGMTVESHASEKPTVTKSTKDGKVNLDFGLPEGPQGPAGPEGPTGPRGARGETGKGLDILGYYNSQETLEAAVASPDAGDAYGGAEAPYDIYIFDGVSGTWKNNGPLSGGEGGPILPENVVTTPGGAEMTLDSGDGPHTITFTDEEEPPLTAEDIVYKDGNVQEAIDGLFTSVSDGKAWIASAITDKGVDTAQDATFQQMAENIGQITGGADTSDATATAGDILAGKTAYTASGKVEGQIPTLAARTYTPGTSPQTIANGQYLGGTQTIQGDPNLTSSNIRKGISIFGVAGAMEPNFLASLTIIADIGAVVSATHKNGTKVEALSTTGTVVLELPLEGQWTITARRGVAQYNSVVINVSSKYNAALTAEVHIEYYGRVSDLHGQGEGIAAASMEGYALFGGGYRYYVSATVPFYHYVEFVSGYDENMTRHDANDLSKARGYLAAAVSGRRTIFAGGKTSNYDGTAGTMCDDADGYNTSLTRYVMNGLSTARSHLSATSIGEYALFGGGYISASVKSAVVDAYQAGTRSTLTGLSLPAAYLSAANSENYALFGGGSDGPRDVTAYDKKLVRTIPTGLSHAMANLAASRAGNYILFAGYYSVDAYDLFLTRTTVESLSDSRDSLAGTTLKNYAIFAGGYRSDAVDVYDPYLVHTTSKTLSLARYNLSAASVGDFSLFAGGRCTDNQSTSSSLTNYYTNVVDAYQYV